MNEKEFLKEHPSLKDWRTKRTHNLAEYNEKIREAIHKTQLDKQKVKESLMRNLGIEETPTDGIWKHKSKLKIEDIKGIFKELGL